MTNLMVPRHLLDVLDIRWHEPLLLFAETGEATDEFIAYLETSDDAKRVLDIVLALLTADIRECMQALDPLTDPVVHSFLGLEPPQRKQTFLNLALMLPADELDGVVAEARRTRSGQAPSFDRNVS